MAKRIVVNLISGETTYRHNGEVIIKRMRPHTMLTIAQNLYRRHWLMEQGTIKDRDGSDILAWVQLIDVKGIKP